MGRHVMENAVLIRTLSERLRELERAQSDATRRLSLANDQIEQTEQSIKTAAAQEKTAHEMTVQVSAEQNELRNHINDILTRNQNQAVSAGSLQALVGTLRLTLEALQKKLRHAHENLREFRTRTQTAMTALEHARTAQAEANEDNVRLTEEVEVLRAHIASLDRH
jgi:chromosome segregation ATPase